MPKSTSLGPYNMDEISSNIWECKSKGLRKELIKFDFKSMMKPTELSNCHVIINEVENLGNRESNFLSHKGDFWVTLSTAITPIDYYIEIFLQEMLVGETSWCYVQTKSSGTIKFKIELLAIDFNNYFFRLNVRHTYEHALKLKENGVKMFKLYPLFAQEYFCRAAKSLISYKPFDVLDEKTEGVNPAKLTSLFQNIQNNIAACLIKQNSFENVIFLTEFVENSSETCIKAVYRRALAFYKMQKFSEAKEIIEKIDYKSNKEFLSLHSLIVKDMKESAEKYNQMVKKMFS